MTHLAHIAERVINRPLLLLPQKADVILWVLGERIGIDAPRPEPEENRFFGQPKMVGRSRFYNVVDGAAVITIEGMLVNRGEWVGAASGVVSYEGIEAQLATALTDANVKSIVLDIDSPGGEATGMYALAAKIRAARKKKPIVALVNDLAASAAYGIAAQANEIIISPTSITGSIGVVLLHVDFSKQLERIGQTATLIFAGAHKVDGHPFAPLPDSVREDLQRDVETFYDRFVETVVAGRGDRINDEGVRGTEARTFIGKQAIKLGLADSVGGLPEAVATANALVERKADLTAAQPARRTETPSLPVAGAGPKGDPAMDWKDISAETLKQHRPDLVSTIESAHDISARLAEARSAGASEARATASAEAAKAERERILGIQAAAFPGQEETVKACIEDGKTTPGEAAIRFNQAEKAKGGQRLQALADADTNLSDLKPAPTATGASSKPAAKSVPQTDEGWKAEYQASEALQAEFASEKHYVAFKQAEKAGSARIKSSIPAAA